MKTGPQNKQRPRGRSSNGGGPKKHLPPRNQTFDSNGPDVRIRGNAHQVLEKYLQLARDATAQGDRIAAENFYQHAEHYFRIINAMNANAPRRPHLPTPADDQPQLADGEDGEDNTTEDSAEEQPSPQQSSRQSLADDGDRAEAVNA